MYRKNNVILIQSRNRIAKVNVEILFNWLYHRQSGSLSTTSFTFLFWRMFCTKFRHSDCILQTDRFSHQEFNHPNAPASNVSTSQIWSEQKSDGWEQARVGFLEAVAKCWFNYNLFGQLMTSNQKQSWYITRGTQTINKHVGNEKQKYVYIQRRKLNYFV